MTVTLTGTVQVDHADLHPAFKSVRAHAAPGKRGDEILPLHRIRLVIDRRYVHVLAANGATTAAARVPIQDDTRPNPEALDDGPFVIDLQPGDVDGFLKVFELRRQRQDTDPRHYRIQLRFSTHELVFEQHPGGMFPGRSLGVEVNEPHESFPDVRRFLGRAVREAGTTAVAKPLVTAPKVLKMFKDAGDTYGQTVRISGTGTVDTPGYLVEVGGLFVGSFGSTGRDDVTMRKHAGWRTDWATALPPLDDATPDYAAMLGGAVDVDDDQVNDQVPDGQLAADLDGTED